MWNRRPSASKLLSIQLLEPIVFVGSNLETSSVIRGTVDVNFPKSAIIKNLQINFEGSIKTQWMQNEKPRQKTKVIASSQLLLYPISSPSPPLLLNSGSTRFSFELPLPAHIPETISCSQVNVDYSLTVSMDYKKGNSAEMHEEIKKPIIVARLPDNGMLAGENYPATIDSHKHYSNWCQYRITIDAKSAALGSKLPLKIEIAPTVKELKLKQLFLQLVERRTVVDDARIEHTTQSVHFLYPVKGTQLDLPNRPLNQNWEGQCHYQIPDDKSVAHSTGEYSSFRVNHLLLVSLIVSLPDSSAGINGRHATRTISFQTNIDLLDSHVAQLDDREFTKLPSYDCPISRKEIETLKRHGLGLECPPTYEEALLAV